MVTYMSYGLHVYLQCNKAGAGGSPKPKLIWCCRIMLYPALPFILNPISISVFLYISGDI